MEHFVYHKKGYLNIIFACKMPFHQCCPPAMDSALPKPEDHCRVQIMVKSVGQFSTVVFNRIFKQLESKLNRLEVLTSQNVRRLVLLKFISETNPDLARFAEFQAFRKVFGLLCIGQHNGAQLNPSSSSPNLGCLAATSTDGHGESPNSMPMANCAGIRRSSLNRLPSVDICDGTDTLEESRQMALLKEQYQKIKRELNDQLVDSRCVLFGFNSHQNSTEVLSFPRSDDLGSLCDQLENVFRELIRSIYVVLDSKRLDSSFERMDTPPYPLLPDEEKYRTGLENVKSKNYRKKCIGRLRKRLADYALLTGFFESALQSYQLAIDLLKATADLLWLAAACEGWCCAAMLVLAHGPNLCQTQSSNSNNHNNKNVDASSSTSHPRQNHLNSTRRGLEQTAKSGHHRYRSDEASKLLSTSFSLLHDSTEVEPLSASSGETSPQVDTQEAMDNNKGTPKNKGKLWQQLLNLDALSSAAQSQPDKHLASISMSSALRSASAHNLALLGQQQQTTASVTGNGPTKKNATGNVSRPEVADRFRQSLENYGRFSFAIHVEYECMMRAVHLPMDSRHYIEVESFLREHTCRFLDDKFTTFNNIMKSKICLDTAQVYNKIGFKRKNAFFLRLAVFFRLFTDTHLENDYKKVYPFLNQSLAGYGIEWRLLSNKNKGTGKSLKARFLADIGSANTFSLQTKAVHEVFTVANRAGLHDIGTRHLCFMLEAFFDHLDKAASLVLVEDLKNRQNGETLHDLERAITLDSTPAVVLPPMQFTKFPILKNFAILPLPAHLAPKVIDRLSFQANVFIYSPFQDRLSNKKEIHWVLNCGTEVFVRAENPLPVELAVDNLMLLTEGCDFVAVPVRLQLPSCYGAPPSQNEPTKNEIKLRGVPRSVGTLKVIGYSCEVLGCRNVCKFHDDQSRPLCVRVLPDLPLLRLETSLKRCPTLSDNPNDAVAEVCVFSGQSFTHTITLQNSSKSIDIRDITIKIQQPQVAAGQKLLKFLNVNAREREQDFKMLGIRAGTSRQMDFRIFGIDPATATPFESNANSTAPKGGGEPKAVTTTATGEQQRVYVRRPRSSTSLATITTESGGSGIGTGCALPRAESSDKNSGTLTNNNNSSSQVQANSAASTKLLDSASTPLLVQEEEEEDGEGEGEEELDTGSNNRHHDLIPYTGRLLSCEFSFTYTADLSSKAEDFVRFAKFPLAITIVPAVNVASWHILAGDSTFTRYIVIDVFNQTDHEAELAYGQQRRTITVQPKEMCRVPLLCSCCRQIKSIAFQRATQRASHMMQMQEIEGLRRTVEKHVVKRLEIQWTIPQLNLNGQVPVGSLLSSVSFLRQLVLPSLTIGIHVEEKSRVDGADINVHIGEIVAVEVSLYYSIGGTMSGHLSLCCHQDLQNGQPPVERPNNILVFGPNSMPFSIVGTKEEEKIRNNDSGGAEDENVEEEESDDDPRSPSTSEMEDQPHQQYKAVFSLVFCYEGVHKISPKVSVLQIRGAPDEFALGQKTTTLSDDDIFIPTLSFNVISKL